MQVTSLLSRHEHEHGESCATCGHEHEHAPVRLGLGEVFVCADEILRATVDVRKVAAASAGNENFLADAVSKFEDRDAPSAFSSFHRA